MNFQTLKKGHRREIRRLAGLAYERELSKALLELFAEFERWRRGEINVFALNEAIHRHHNGKSRDLFKFYAMGNPDWSAVAAIVNGVIQENEVEPRTLEDLRPDVESFRQRQTEGSSNSSRRAKA